MQRSASPPWSKQGARNSYKYNLRLSVRYGEVWLWKVCFGSLARFIVWLIGDRFFSRGGRIRAPLLTRSRAVPSNQKHPMKTRDQIDQIAWDTIHKMASLLNTPSGLKASGRPLNYEELAELTSRKDFQFAWPEFLHEFFRYKRALFFALPPPDMFRREYRALLVGVAAYLSAEFGLPAAWVDDPEYTLTEPWDQWEDLCPDMAETREYRAERISQAFRKRNIIYEARNLITLRPTGGRPFPPFG